MFENKSIVSMWGHHRTYRVVKVAFDKNPKTLKFTHDSGEQLSVADYFKKNYKFILREDQPLFLAEVNGFQAYIPPQYCVMDGIHEELRNDKRAM